MEILDVIQAEIRDVLAQVKEEEMEAALRIIKKTSRIFVGGEGRSGLTAKGFAMRLMHLGYTVYVVGETITPALRKDDVFIGVSGSGGSAAVVNDARKAKTAGGVVLAVTSKKDSPLAGAADQTLCIPGTVRGDSGSSRTSIQLLSSLFDQSLHISLDALCCLISRRDAVGNDAATGMHW
ncbi:MAG: SIS domain-containing protein [Spirochaetaceae bacterium]|jgi:6-phospho-3-hexuloisomerase|nr:SIS domain-containing protein [Spirochaetaceae bacterium]